MPKFEKILLPIDFEDSCKPLAHQAAILARHFQSEIVLLHAVTPLSYAGGLLEGSYVPYSLADLQAELLRQAESRIDKFLAPELEGINVRRLLLEGDPAEIIVKTAKEEKASLIMLATHGYGVFRRFLLGSVTAKVLHDSSVPVWTGAHMQNIPAKDFAIRRVLCAIDLREHSATTAVHAAELAAEFGADLTLIHALAPMEPYGPGEYVVEPEWEQAMLDAAKRDIAKIQKELSVRADVRIESGDPPRTISQVALKAQADVLVVGRASHGRLRATGYGIIRESPIPVLSV